MKHPNPAIQQTQERFLASCPDDSKAFHAQLLRLGNAALCYHQLALNGQVVTEEDFAHWLEGLCPQMREQMKKDGFEKCRTYLPFIRHVMERRDIGMDAWMQQYLSLEDYQVWKGSYS